VVQSCGLGTGVLATGLAMGLESARCPLGHQLKPQPVRTTEFAPALPPTPPHATPAAGYAPPAVGSAWKAGRFAGQDFALQADGTLWCPANQTLTPHEYRREADGSLRVVYGASIRSCRSCPMREQCQWNGNTTAKPRQVSVLLHPLSVGSKPLLWHDWSRRLHRHACIHLLRHQRVEIQAEPGNDRDPATPALFSRAERAHTRLSWAKRLARNARPHAKPRVTIHLFGIEAWFATSLGLATA